MTHPSLELRLLGDLQVFRGVERIDLDSLKLQSLLAHLTQNATYDFSHGKLREVAYQELSLPRRHFFHLQVARVLDCCSDTAQQGLCALEAYHYERAGAYESAIPAYVRGGDDSRRLYAHHEAVRFYSHALRLL